jgi:hypothetical protein
MLIMGMDGLISAEVLDLREADAPQETKAVATVKHRKPPAMVEAGIEANGRAALVVACSALIADLAT